MSKVENVTTSILLIRSAISSRPTSAHAEAHIAPPLTEYCTVCHCPIFQHQCWSVLQKSSRFSLEPFSLLTGTSQLLYLCYFFSPVIARVLLSSCSCHNGQGETYCYGKKHIQTSVTNNPSFIKIFLKKRDLS